MVVLLWRGSPGNELSSRSGRGRARAWHLRRLASSLVAARPSRASCSACPLSCLGRERGPEETGNPPTGPLAPRQVLVASGRAQLTWLLGALSHSGASRCDILPQGSKPLPPGSLDALDARMGHPDDGLFVRTDLLPTAGASHNEDRTTKTHAAGYVPPRHATAGGQKIMQYEYQEFVNAREAAKKERRPKGAAPVLPPKKVTKEGKKPPPPYVNDPTSYYTADQLLSVDGCICDKVRVVLDERTGEPRRDYRNDETREYGDMMNMKRSDDPLKSRTFSHKEVLFPSDRSVKREIREGFKYVEHADEWEKTILQTQGQKRTYYTQDQAMQVLRDDFRASLPRPGSARRETLRRK